MGWSKSLTGFADFAEAEAEVLLTDMAEDMSRGVIYGSPKDTSRFLSNNNFSVNGPDESYDPDRRDASRSDTLANARLAIASLRLGDTLYIVNTTPYGEMLEHGHSGQAPAGIFGVAFNSTSEKFR
ncbi:MAG: hypothetical protein CL583_07420 [Alteromonadaceae bacterium]|nr:hypothetical protein [Alteromonadaceae bacterium]